MTASRPRRPLPTSLGLLAACLFAAGCGPSAPPASIIAPVRNAASEGSERPAVDPRIGLRAGLMNAGEAAWNLRIVSSTAPSRPFVGHMNSDLAFMGHHVIQGNYRGFQIWDISDPARPQLVRGIVCPGAQNDVSVYGHLLFMSVESLDGRLDCGGQGVSQAISPQRMLGIRIFDLKDPGDPKLVANVQTCRGSHTHTVVADPRDTSVVYIYVSGSAPVRAARELPGCSDGMPHEDPHSSLFRIEIIAVPLADPAQARIVNAPSLLAGLVEPPRHGLTNEDMAAIQRARAAGRFVAELDGQPFVLSHGFAAYLLDSISNAWGTRGRPTAADSQRLRRELPRIMARYDTPRLPGGARIGPTQCHDITVYSAIALAGGACEGYGVLIDISDPANPRRLQAVADSNFAYWHSATFSSAGTKILFTDEWKGGGPACRASDPPEWGANAIYTFENGEMRFRSYYKLPVVQTEVENCVAHNGSLIPVPGRDIMVQAWYQGGVSVFDWTDPDQPFEIAFHDRGPVNARYLTMGGSWSAYWYNGYVVSSEIARGLDIFELVPSPYLSRNEIDAARTVRLNHLNVQAQPYFVWPPSFALARACVDQIERAGGLPEERISRIRADLVRAEGADDVARPAMLSALAAELSEGIPSSPDPARLDALREAVQRLAAAEQAIGHR